MSQEDCVNSNTIFFDEKQYSRIINRFYLPSCPSPIIEVVMQSIENLKNNHDIFESIEIISVFLHELIDPIFFSQDFAELFLSLINSGTVWPNNIEISLTYIIWKLWKIAPKDNFFLFSENFVSSSIIYFNSLSSQSHCFSYDALRFVVQKQEGVINYFVGMGLMQQLEEFLLNIDPRECAEYFQLPFYLIATIAIKSQPDDEYLSSLINISINFISSQHFHPRILSSEILKIICQRSEKWLAYLLSTDDSYENIINAHLLNQKDQYRFLYPLDARIINTQNEKAIYMYFEEDGHLFLNEMTKYCLKLINPTVFSTTEGHNLSVILKFWIAVMPNIWPYLSDPKMYTNRNIKPLILIIVDLANDDSVFSDLKLLAAHCLAQFIILAGSNERSQVADGACRCFCSVLSSYDGDELITITLHALYCLFDMNRDFLQNEALVDLPEILDDIDDIDEEGRQYLQSIKQLYTE